MALQKQPVSINFMKGLETKTDPYQIPVDSFALMNNSVFTTLGRLTKRNGFRNITDLPNALQTNLTTLNDTLVATGTDLYAYSSDTNQWLNKGIVQPVQLSTNAIIRTSASQVSPDAAIASNSLVCTVYMDTNGNSYYQIADSTTGQEVIQQTQLEATAVNPRAFMLGNYFIITYMATNGVPTLKYLAIPIANPTTPGSPVTFSATVSAITDGYDGYVFNNKLYLAWSASSTSVDIGFLTNTLAISPTTSTTTSAVTSLISVTADLATNRVYLSFYSGGTIYAASFTSSLAPVMTLTSVVTTANVVELTSIFQNGILNIFYETLNVVVQLNSTDQDFITLVTVTPPVGAGTGTPGSPTVILRSVGLASKPFINNNTIFMLAAYGQPSTSNQPSYFLIDSTGQIYMRLAYSNGGGYESSQVLPTVSFMNEDYFVPFLFKDFLTSVNKSTNAGVPSAAVYTQTGVNLATFTIEKGQQYPSEIAESLHLTGGMLWQYDGVKPVEHNFQVWPEDMTGTGSMAAGSMTAQQYYYQFTYEWTDNAGNIHRSAPSIPLGVLLTAGQNTATLYVPTLRLTSKLPPNPVRIVGYRWSLGQQNYYQFTSVSSPYINDTTVDYITITDTSSDSEIVGNALIYTTGGVIENIAAPASTVSALFNNRLWLVDAEDQNLLWYSKQVIEAVPVEMSDLLTLFVAPTSGAQGSTGVITALAPMDDKLIIFKKDAIYYINGVGPDNTGANSQYSDPIFITTAVGCSNPNSIVLMQNGLMFQSDKGIWLLGRDLSTNYIGAPVESFNSHKVLSAENIPMTTQVRFILDNSMTLMYDYYVNQWGTHTNIAAISGTIYQSEQTYLNSYGQVFQETPGTYIDGSNPVLMSFTTAWINIAGLQGYERFYFGFLLGTYYTPFTLNVQLAYDYNASAVQNIKVTPDNYVKPWGGEAQWGSGASWGAGTIPSPGNGGTANIFEARFFPQFQKCESFQVTITEVFDPTYGTQPGQGLSLSGLNLVVGVKKGYRTQRAARSFGSN
jgi:hypothetical protein